MSLQSYIENLRAKPEHIRRRVAFCYSFGITAIIFVFWLSSFYSFGSTAKSRVAGALDKAGAPATSLLASVGSLFGDIKDLIFSPKKVIYEVEVKAGNR